MPSTNLMPFTGKPDFYSGIASASASMTPCNPGRLLSFRADETSGAEPPKQAEQLRVMLNVKFVITSGVVEFPEPLQVRFLCHALLAQLPDEALAEVSDSLREMRDYYGRPRAKPALPAPPVAIPAKYVGSYDRPVFHATEE